MVMGRRFLFVGVLCFLLPAAAFPEDGPEPPGGLWVRGADGQVVFFPLKRTAVRAAISGPLAAVEVEQVYENPSEEVIEAYYTFPLPDLAAVDDMEIAVGDRVIRGKIAEREEAEELYAGALEEGYTAALLDQERPNIFEQKVGNIPPRSTVAVRLHYLERLREKAGRTTFLFPTVVLFRYGGSGALVEEPGSPDDDQTKPLPPEIAITVDLESPLPLGDIESPSHRVDIQRENPRRASVTLAPGDRMPDKDFRLEFGVPGGPGTGGLLAHGRGGEGFFLLLLQPGSKPDRQETPPREIIFVLDASGSMEGPPIQMAKELILGMLARLEPRDAFNLVAFADTVSKLGPASQPVSATSIAAAQEWLAPFNGVGGTEFLIGLQEAFSLPRESGRRPMVVFLTDGGYAEDDAVLRAIKETAKGTQVFTVGVSAAANHYLLDRMASLAGGDYLMVRPDADPAAATGDLGSLVEGHGLTDLTIDWGRLGVTELVPDPLPPLAPGRPLALIGRYLWSGKETLILKGTQDGRPWEKQIEVEFPAEEPRHASLASLWARARIDGLLLDSPGEERPEIKAEVLALGLQFHLMSPYTSFVAVDEVRAVDPGSPRQRVFQPLMAPEFTSLAAVFGDAGPEVWSRSIVRLDPDPGYSGGCEVRVVDENGTPLAGVKAIIWPVIPPEKSEWKATDARGRVLFGNLQPGEGRNIDFRKPGYTTARATVDIATGKIQNLRVELIPESAEEVPVKGRIQYALAGPPPPPPPPGGVQGGIVGGVVGGVPGAVLAASSPVSGGTITKTLVMTVDGVSQFPPEGLFPVKVPRWEMGSSTGSAKAAALGFLDLSRTDAAVLAGSLRVLADLAIDGRLNAAAGRPALASLLALQFPSGAFSADIRIHALGTWALIEAASSLTELREKEWSAQAARRALAHLAKVRLDSKSWPLVALGESSAVATGYARLAQRAGYNTGLWSAQQVPPRPEPTAGREADAQFLDQLLSALKKTAAGRGKAGGLLDGAGSLLAAAGRGHLAAAR